VWRIEKPLAPLLITELQKPFADQSAPDVKNCRGVPVILAPKCFKNQKQTKTKKKKKGGGERGGKKKNVGERGGRERYLSIAMGTNRIQSRPNLDSS
jgi:hypothetical protein